MYFASVKLEVPLIYTLVVYCLAIWSCVLHWVDVMLTGTMKVS